MCWVTLGCSQATRSAAGAYQPFQPARRPAFTKGDAAAHCADLQKQPGDFFPSLHLDARVCLGAPDQLGAIYNGFVNGAQFSFSIVIIRLLKVAI